MKVYISGKIGEEVISEGTRRKFARAEEMLRAKGHTVVNPASEEFQMTMETEFMIFRSFMCYESILLYDLGWLRTCTAIYMLADWQESNGANVELDFATATGKQRFWEREDDAKIFCDESGNYQDVWLPIEGGEQ